MSVNAHRGEVGFETADGRLIVLRPSFAALVAVEDTLGSILGLATRAEKGVTVEELSVLFHHCARAIDPQAPDTQDFGALILAKGIVPSLAVFKALMEIILGGDPD